jgi:Lipocalin-like domain
MVGTRSLSSGAHSRDPVALPTRRLRLPLGQARNFQAIFTTENFMQKFVLITVAGMMLSSHAVAAEVVLPGTYKLVSEQRTIVDTGEVISTTSSQGYISYGTDGRMIVLIVRSPRPKPEGAEKITDQQRIDLFRTMTAYAGTYKFDGSTIEHSIEISMNEIWRAPNR